jgi:hypothetical protein
MEAVGLGCIWFAWRGVDIDEIEIKEFVPSAHVAEIRSALEGLESVTALEITGNENRVSGIWGLEDNTEDNIFFPLFSSLVIRFNIIVPLRFQEKYTLGGRTADGVETFHVKVIYEGPMPVTYIHYTVKSGEDGARNYSPSTAVVVVRRFLEEKLEGHPTVLFQMLGPSPFHADIFVDQMTPTMMEIAKDLTLPGDGYRTLYFRSAEKSSDARIADFANQHQGGLAAYYMLVRLRNHERRLRQSVTDGALNLLQPSEQKGRWAAFQHWRGHRERIDAVFEALLQEKLSRIAQDRFEAELKRDDTVERSSLFYQFIERALGDATQMPDEDIRELLIMLEERRRGYFENLSTLVSGLLGGLLGAALGAFLTFGLADHTSGKPVQANPASNNAGPNISPNVQPN